MTTTVIYEEKDFKKIKKRKKYPELSKVGVCVHMEIENSSMDASKMFSTNVNGVEVAFCFFGLTLSLQEAKSAAVQPAKRRERERERERERK